MRSMSPCRRSSLALPGHFQNWPVEAADAPGPVPPLPAGGFAEGLGEARALARYQERPVFVHFTAAWCEPCRQLEAEVYPAPEVRDRLARFVRARVDVESDKGRAAWLAYSLNMLPTLSFFDPAMEEVRELRLEGALEPEALTEALDRAIARLAPPPISVRERNALRKLARGEPLGPPPSPHAPLPMRTADRPLEVPQTPTSNEPRPPGPIGATPPPARGRSGWWWALPGGLVVGALALLIRRRGGGASPP